MMLILAVTQNSHYGEAAGVTVGIWTLRIIWRAIKARRRR